MWWFGGEINGGGGGGSGFFLLVCYTHGFFMLLSEMHAPFKQPNTASRQPLLPHAAFTRLAIYIQLAHAAFSLHMLLLDNHIFGVFHGNLSSHICIQLV